MRRGRLLRRLADKGLAVALLCGCGSDADEALDFCIDVEQPEPIVERHVCITFPTYTGVDKPCALLGDCDLPSSPCEERVCTNGFCSVLWKTPGADACGNVDLLCQASSCCGVVATSANLTVECTNPGQCPTPEDEQPPDCKRRLCLFGKCVEHVYAADSCYAFD